MNSLSSQIQNITQIALNRIENFQKRKLVPTSRPSKKTKLQTVHRAKWGPLKKEFNFSSSDQNSSTFTEDQENLSISPTSSFTNSDQIERLNKELEQAKLTLQFLQNSLKEMSLENSSLKELLSQSESYRKLLHAQLQELRGPIRVFCRVKPFTNKNYVSYPEAKLQENYLRTITIEKDGIAQTFTFDRVFRESTTQNEIFEEIIPFLQSAIDGEHVSIFSYGQTGSGKTYTLEGSDFEENAGILPRAASWIYKYLEKCGVQSSLQIKLSCIEVYMEQVTDLLSDHYNVLKLKANSKGSLEVEGISWHQAESFEGLLRLIGIASNGRMTRSTHLNNGSSRGHTIYQIRIEGLTMYGNEIKGKLSVIDLAGSERANVESYSDKSQNEIEAMKVILSEAKYINTSLSCLRRVILALLARRSGNSQIPPYRESKLTRLLQDSLNSGKVVMLVAISPDNFSETRESLKFGGQAQVVNT
ncbi:unnamed protein product [Blepharisma stoltei]|uniref:Kinesin-like protein n=1 Tax=Blepharisma stoltei TaxID=1481888 RepID=A0AAU9JXW9_9CILI|nr:unnamed protein product [Blepharisma stoltei]